MSNENAKAGMKQVSIIPMLKFDNVICPFKIQSIKDLVNQPGRLNESVHVHDYYEIVWIINGRGTLFVDLTAHAIENNMIFCLKPNQAHQFTMYTDMEGFVFSFTDAFFNAAEYEFDTSVQSSLYQLFNQCRPIRVQQMIEEEVRDVSLKMKKEYENQYPFRALLLKRYFRIFLLLLSRQDEGSVEGVGQTRETELVKRFMEMLDKNFREEKMVCSYAAQLYITPTYLNKTVKKNTGYSAGHHIRQRIILEAKRLARYSDLGMKEIAYKLGYLDNAYFSRFFKAVAGTNFSDFKKEN